MKVFYFLLFLFLTFGVIAEKIQTDIVNIPTDYEGLKKKYIEAVLDVFKEQDKQRETLLLLSNVQAQNSNLIVLVKDLKVKLEKAMNVSRDTFQNYFSLSSGYDFEQRVASFGLGWNLMIYEKLLFGVRAYFPTAISFEAGYRFK